jgi:hypothetical protein
MMFQVRLEIGKRSTSTSWLFRLHDSKDLGPELEWSYKHPQLFAEYWNLAKDLSKRWDLLRTHTHTPNTTKSKNNNDGRDFVMDVNAPFSLPQKLSRSTQK